MPAPKNTNELLQMVQKSGLLDRDALQSFVERFRDDGGNTDEMDTVATALVDKTLITPWQHARIIKGKYRGFLLGKYRLLDQIGAGGMGTVYLGEHVLLHRRCAIKVLAASRVNDASYLDRFLREARSVAALDHPNIVRAYDVDFFEQGEEKIYYLAMEYVEGRDIHVIVSKDGPLDFVTAADITRQAAEGLAAAHKASLVHRDVKPANLLRDKTGIVKLLDLGLAKSFAEEDDEEASLTRSHNETMLGTADYLSPEQAIDSHTVGPSADIYSLGCTLYFMLTGHPPFHTGTVANRILAHQIKPPPPVEDDRPDTPPELAAILNRLMEKDPANRQPDCNVVAEELLVWLANNTEEEWTSPGPVSTPAKIDSTKLRAGSASGVSALRRIAARPGIGIDLGTTFSVIACLDANGFPTTIPNEEGEITTPSVVFFDRAAPVVGNEAIRAAQFEPERFAQFAKRDIGETNYSKLIGGQQLPPEVIEAILLRKLKGDAERKLGAISEAVITVPAYFNEPRRKATQDAGVLAGIKVLDLINEPTAAAIAYGVTQGFLKEDGSASSKETILVYDLGGGTFDATLMEIDGRNYHTLGTAGDVLLGGVDWDERIVNRIAEVFESKYGVDVREDPVGRQNLTTIATDAKRALSTRQNVTMRYAHDGQRIRFKITREDFKVLTADLLDRTRWTIARVLREADRTWSDVTRLLLVGGSTQMPMVAEMLEEESGLQVDRTLSPEEAVAHGAAIYAGILLNQGQAARLKLSVKNVNSHDLGILGVEASTKRTKRHIMTPRNTPLPVRTSNTFRTQKDGQRRVVVQVVEGGDASGANSTPIGACVVEGLPPDVKARTPVKVTFKYAANGLLTVSARLPTIEKEATLKIQRSAGLTAEQIEEWKKRLDDGFAVPDEMDIDDADIIEDPIDISDQHVEIDGDIEVIDDEIEVVEEDIEVVEDEIEIVDDIEEVSDELDLLDDEILE